MDILVKGMDMPCMCCLCPCHDWDTETDRYYCQALKGEPRIVDENTRRDDCPLVEVPTPHGRLIDADSLVYELCEFGHYKVDKEEIDSSETIIEAEE